VSPGLYCGCGKSGIEEIFSVLGLTPEVLVDTVIELCFSYAWERKISARSSIGSRAMARDQSADSSREFTVVLIETNCS
jgi:hypothetical protein